MTASAQAPQAAAVSAAFVDSYEKGGVLSGPIQITRATYERTIFNDNMYWGSDDQTKLPNTEAIATLPKSSSDLTYNIPSGTVKPLNATHFLARTKNKIGEMKMGPITASGTEADWKGIAAMAKVAVRSGLMLLIGMTG